MSKYNHDQELLAREIRTVLADFDFTGMDREDIREVLEEEAVTVGFGSVHGRSWLEGLEEIPEEDKQTKSTTEGDTE